MTTTTVTEAVLNQIAGDIHSTALDKGFWAAPDPMLAELNTKLMLIVSEAAEAQEVIREQYDGEINAYTHMTAEQGEKFIEELADIIIRTFDLAQYFEGALPNVGEVILSKMAKNTARPQMHGKRF